MGNAGGKKRGGGEFLRLDLRLGRATALGDVPQNHRIALDVGRRTGR